ncbi:Aste57867_1075 [Aphanomyces stellatus]|uniref:Aste57867_1075 protein n=1 Tax=Aphanomyces stellatus TaxID=120398 RepID=A0A485K6X6_9STRA|nr:hypothetical protein As57867_001074 [Aphanomyces stellatus]VFT78297.1 Aste57867_1075 [Aphanomyces stellatus]
MLNGDSPVRATNTLHIVQYLQQNLSAQKLLSCKQLFVNHDPNKRVQLGWNGETVPNDFTLVKLRLKAGVLLAKYGCLQAPPARRIRRAHLHPPAPQEQTHVATVLDDGKIDTIESLGLV